jgi:hypothetical protein
MMLLQMTHNAQNTTFSVLDLHEPLTPLESSGHFMPHPNSLAPVANSNNKHSQSPSFKVHIPEPQKKHKAGVNKENRQPKGMLKPGKGKKGKLAALEASAAVAIKVDEVLRSPQWSNVEKTRLFEWLLGVDSEEQEAWFTHKKNPYQIYKKVLTLCSYSDAF